MERDPAFLFYSKDYYEGTRMMLPEERACYIDLLIYQHQNGTIPNDLKRVLMYCNGVDEATLKATLKEKFIEINGGWENEVLNKRISERESYKTKQSESGKLGQFWKKAKAILNEKDFKILQKLNSNKPLIVDFISKNEITLKTLKGLLKQRLNNNANEIENEDAIVDEEETEDLKGGVGEFLEMPDEFKPIWDKWLEYRKAKKKKPYAGLKWEQIAVNNFLETAKFDFTTAQQILKQTIEHNWEGLHELKADKNGATTTKTEFRTVSDDYARKIAESLQSGQLP